MSGVPRPLHVPRRGNTHAFTIVLQIRLRLIVCIPLVDQRIAKSNEYTRNVKGVEMPVHQQCHSCYSCLCLPYIPDWLLLVGRFEFVRTVAVNLQAIRTAPLDILRYTAP